jgi:hypothetical protein
MGRLRTYVDGSSDDIRGKEREDGRDALNTMRG